jgi:hypothetical protein
MGQQTCRPILSITFLTKNDEMFATVVVRCLVVLTLVWGCIWLHPSLQYDGRGVVQRNNGSQATRESVPLAEFLPAKSGPLRNVAQFNRMEIRTVRDLSHLDQGTLGAMQQYGFSWKTKSSDTIILHQLEQNPAARVVERPSEFHSIGNEVQHPFGNMEGVGLTDAERAAFND